MVAGLSEAGAWVETDKDGEISITVASMDKPEVEGDPGDCYTIKFNLFDLVTEKASEYKGMTGDAPKTLATSCVPIVANTCFATSLRV